MNQHPQPLCSLPFEILRIANMQRLPLFRNKHGKIAHNSVDDSDWSLSQWIQAIAGELGEYANFRKKFDREDLTETQFKIEAANELADTFTYVDILAARCGISIEHLTIPNNFGAYQAELTEAYNVQYHGPAPASMIAEGLGIAVTKLGELSRAVCTIHDQGRRARVAPYLFEFVDQLFGLAVMLDIDLGLAVHQKFNHVSDKVKANVFIHQADMSDSNGQVWYVSDIPF